MRPMRWAWFWWQWRIRFCPFDKVVVYIGSHKYAVSNDSQNNKRNYEIRKYTEKLHKHPRQSGNIIALFIYLSGNDTLFLQLIANPPSGLELTRGHWVWIKRDGMPGVSITGDFTHNMKQKTLGSSYTISDSQTLSENGFPRRVSYRSALWRPFLFWGAAWCKYQPE